MVDVRRLGKTVLVCAGTLVAACGIHGGSKDAKSAKNAAEPAPKWSDASLATAEAADAGVVTPAFPVVPMAPGPATALANFKSKEELVAWLREAKLVRPAPPPSAAGDDPLSAKGNMWGDAIGDSFGAGGLGLSGAGEGGGGQGEGIGLGSIGTVGHGAGAGTSASSSPSVTNTQHAGVDEGGIVKVHGEHLVVLRRGRLFTVRLGDLAPISAVDAFGPGIDPGGAWYDEMLVSDDTIVVIGYSYARGGTEIGLFDLDASGHIAARSTHHMRANDYYSSRNYASRLIGDQLVFYSPLYVNADERDPLAWLPAVRRWKNGAKARDFTAIIEPTSITRPLDRPNPSDGGLALHTVTTCDLGKHGAGAAANGGMKCTARGVLGPAGRVFYVSPEAVYVWMTPWAPVDAGQHTPRSLLYRLPLDPTAPAKVLRTRGAPIDQFSFLERDGYLNVAVRSEGNGDAMWSPELTAGGMAMLRVPVGSFGARADTAPDSSYVTLPALRGNVMHNRFVGDYLLYGTGQGWGRQSKPLESNVVVHRYAGTSRPVQLPLTHGADRIEPLGDDAVVIGTDGTDLTFSSIALDGGGRSAFVADRYTRKNVAQGELRSHGFFYRDDGDRAGIVGLPIRGGKSAGWEHIVDGSASVLYLRNDGLHFHELGALEARASSARVDDRCRASCVDWYGNARPLFVRGRVLALMGYEIVEGHIDAGRLGVERRISFAPR